MFNTRLCTKNQPRLPGFPRPRAGLAPGELPRLFPRGLRVKCPRLLRGAAPGLSSLSRGSAGSPRLQQGPSISLSSQSFPQPPFPVSQTRGGHPQSPSALGGFCSRPFAPREQNPQNQQLCSSCRNSLFSTSSSPKRPSQILSNSGISSKISPFSPLSPPPQAVTDTGARPDPGDSAPLRTPQTRGEPTRGWGQRTPGAAPGSAPGAAPGSVPGAESPRIPHRPCGAAGGRCPVQPRGSSTKNFPGSPPSPPRFLPAHLRSGRWAGAVPAPPLPDPIRPGPALGPAAVPGRSTAQLSRPGERSGAAAGACGAGV